MLFLRAAALGILVTLLGWLVVHPVYLQSNGVEFVGNPDYIRAVEGLLAGRENVLYVPPLFPQTLVAMVNLGARGVVSAGTAYALLVLVCVGASSGLIAILVPYASGSERRALIGAALWAANPLAFWFSTYVSPETVFIPFLLASVYAMLRAASSQTTSRYAWAAASGAAIGLAMLTRPVAIGMPFVFASVLLWLSGPARRLNALAQGALIAIVAVIVTMPWEIELHRSTGRWLPLSNNGPASTIDGLTFTANVERGRAPIWTSAASRRAQDFWLAHQDEFLTGRRSIPQGIVDQTRADPASMLALLAEKVARSWYATYNGTRMTGVAVVQALVMVLLISASWKVWTVREEAGMQTAYLLLITGWALIAYTWCMTIMVLSIARYMVPSLAPLFGLAGFLVAPRQRGN